MEHERDDIERTEAPSPRNTARVRDEGYWPRSSELVVACTLLAGLLTVRCAGDWLSHGFQEMLATSLVEPSQISGIARWDASRAWTLRAICRAAPCLFIPACVAALVNMAQVGVRLRPRQLMPSWHRFNAAENLRNAFSGSSAKLAAASAIKWLCALALSMWWCWNALVVEDFSASPAVGIRGAFAARLALDVATKTCVLLVLFGLVDYARAWIVHLQQLRMTPAEVRSELRETEGDPLRRRRLGQRQAQANQVTWEKQLNSDDLILVAHSRCAVVVRNAAGRYRCTGSSVGTAVDAMQRAARRKGVRVVRNDRLARTIRRACKDGAELSQETMLELSQLERVRSERVSTDPSRFHAVSTLDGSKQSDWTQTD